jgi:hypothetical protein
MYRPRALLTLAVAVGLVLAGCDSGGSGMEAPDRETTFQQSFDNNTDGWVTGETSGQQGWCGDLTQHGADSGPTTPSAGEGYAAAAGAACNSYWQDQGFPRSGPFSPSGGFSSTWPENGFVNEIDIYLDPSWAAGMGFGYSVSVLDQDGNHLKSKGHSGYFIFHVAADSSTGDLLLATSNQLAFTPPQNLESGEHLEVPGAGWYTFRHTFRDDGGTLAVDLEVLRGEEVLFETMHSTSFDIAETVGGNEYAWFTFIPDGLRLPVDEHRLRQ